MGVLGTFWNRAKQGVGKVLGAVQQPLKRLGQVAIGVGRFALENHQILSARLQGASDLMPQS